MQQPSEREPFSLHRIWTGRGAYLLFALILLAVSGIGVALYAATGTPVGDPGSAVDRGVRTVPSATQPTRPSTPTTQPTTPSTVPTTQPSTKAPTTPTQPLPPLRVLPSSNEVLQPFSGEAPVYNPTLRLWQTHNGTDFAAALHSDVKAVCDGTVAAVRQDVRLGTVIEILHADGVVSRYAGVQAGVEAGQPVVSGQKIGSVGTVPGESHLPPHLHMEIEVGGKPVDPVRWIGQTVRTVASAEPDEPADPADTEPVKP